MPEEVRQDQYRDHWNSGSCGYIGLSWPDVTFMKIAALQVHAPNFLFGMFPDWTGGNGETRPLTNDKCEPFPALAELLRFRDEELRPWLRGDAARAYYVGIRESVKTVPGEHANDRFKRLEEATNEFGYFVRHLYAAVNLINFVELHKHEPNLALDYG